MEVIKLAPGLEEPEGEDYVKIDSLPNDKGFLFTGTVLLTGEGPGAVFATGSTKADGPYLTEVSAETAAIEWARSHGSVTVYVLPFVASR